MYKVMHDLFLRLLSEAQPYWDWFCCCCLVRHLFKKAKKIVSDQGLSRSITNQISNHISNQISNLTSNHISNQISNHISNIYRCDFSSLEDL